MASEYHEPVYLTAQECRVIKTALKQYQNNTLPRDSVLRKVIENLPIALKP